MTKRTYQDRKAYMAEWRAKNRERWLSYHRKWYKEHGKENYEANPQRRLDANKKWRTSPQGKATIKEINKRRQVREREKNKARWALARKIRDGKIKRQPCEICGELDAQAHHTDYSEPFDVTWLCALHHRETHGCKR